MSRAIFLIKSKEDINKARMQSLLTLLTKKFVGIWIAHCCVATLNCGLRRPRHSFGYFNVSKNKNGRLSQNKCKETQHIEISRNAFIWLFPHAQLLLLLLLVFQVNAERCLRVHVYLNVNIRFMSVFACWVSILVRERDKNNCSSNAEWERCLSCSIPGALRLCRVFDVQLSCL